MSAAFHGEEEKDHQSDTDDLFLLIMKSDIRLSGEGG